MGDPAWGLQFRVRFRCLARDLFARIHGRIRRGLPCGLAERLGVRLREVQRAGLAAPGGFELCYAPTQLLVLYARLRKRCVCRRKFLRLFARLQLGKRLQAMLRRLCAIAGASCELG